MFKTYVTAVTLMAIVGLAPTSATASFNLVEDFTNPDWQGATKFWGVYPVMVDGTNGWTVTQGGYGGGAGVKDEAVGVNATKQINSFWEGTGAGDQPAGISRADLPSLISGEFEFSWHDGYGAYTNWQVELRDKDDNVAATIRHDGRFAVPATGKPETNSSQVSVNGTVMTGSGYSSTSGEPTNITAAWDINANEVTVDVIDGFGGDNVSLGLTETIQNGAGAITQWIFTSGNNGDGAHGGGIEMTGHWDSNYATTGNASNIIGYDVDGIRISGVELPEPAGLVLMGIGSLVAFRRRR